jgi:transposase-like protein
MLERGVVVSYETVRRWCAKFGQAYAGALRRRQPRAGTSGSTFLPGLVLPFVG